MKVIFVGIHIKDGRPALCSYTKSGKLIDRVIKKIDYDSLKTNLYDINCMPIGTEMRWQLSRDWQEKIDVDTYDIIVLLGQEVHLNFIYLNLACSKFIKAAHPASKRSHIDMNEYIEDLVKNINLLAKKN